MPTDIRAQLRKLMAATINDEAARHDWTYRAVRPMPVPPTWKPGQQVVGDCSKGVQYLCRWAGAPDPMGNGWAVWGNSQTICMHLRHLSSLDELDVGDVITFGWNGDKHAAMVMALAKPKGRTASDVTLWGFGHQEAPSSSLLSQDSRQHQLLKMPIPAYTPTPDDRLRAETGYWAWMQWKLGEGDWKHKPPADPEVRPTVPRLIPPAWWTRRLQFILNRKKP